MALLREMLCWFLTGITPTVQNHTCACSVRKKNGGGRVHIFTTEMPLPPKTSILGVTKNNAQICMCSTVKDRAVIDIMQSVKVHTSIVPALLAIHALTGADT